MALKRNIIHEIQDVTSGGIDEPITLQDAKNYLRLEGFIDVDSSGDTDFTDDDDFIADCITATREATEGETGLVLTPRELRVYFTNETGSIRLPGPVIGSIVLTDSDGDTLEGTYTGGQFKACTYCGCNLIAQYNAGYSKLPAGLRIDMLRCIAQVFKNRGDVAGDALRLVRKFSNTYSRRSWLV